MHKVKVAINRSWKDKAIHFDDNIPDEHPDWERQGNISQNWINVEVDLQHLFDNIHKGYAVNCHLLSSDKQYVLNEPVGYRAEQNFVVSNVVLVDIDHGMTLDEALSHPFYQSYGTGAYTTSSHTEEEHRFRLVFRTEVEIDNGPYMRRIRAALNGIFGGDRKTVDAARAFFGNAGCWYELNEERFIPSKELPILWKTGKEIIREESERRQAKNRELKDNSDLFTEVEIYTSRYVNPISQRDGVTLVRSPKATGKTYQLQRIVADYKAQGKSVLLIGHRVQLLKSMANKLELDFYKEQTHGESIAPAHYAICINSLPRISSVQKAYDIVILDESEQVLQHLVGGTLIKEKRKHIVNLFYRHIQKAKAVYCLDADLGELTAEAIRDLRGAGDRYYAVLNEFAAGGSIKLWLVRKICGQYPVQVKRQAHGIRRLQQLDRS